MEQSELNAVAQKWLEALLHPVDTSTIKPPFDADRVPTGSQDLDDVLQNLRYIMKLQESPKTSLRAGGTHLAVLGRSIAAYLHVALETHDLFRAGQVVNQQTSKWLLSIFKLLGKDLMPFFHDDPKDGLIRAAQLALHRKVSHYSTMGSDALKTSTPVFYFGDTGNLMDCFSILATLGLPPSAGCKIPTEHEDGALVSMNLGGLEAAIEKDVEEGRVPVMVVAYAGTPLAGHVDDLVRIRELCTQHNIWMHVQGHGLSTLCLPEDVPEVAVAREADSLTLSPGTWFGLLSCPYLTYHRIPFIVEPDKMVDDVFPPPSLNLPEDAIPIPRVRWNGMAEIGITRLLPLTLWLSLQYLGASTLVETVSYCSNLTQHMISRLDEVPGVRRFDIPNHRSFAVLFKYFGGGEIEFSSPVVKLEAVHTSPEEAPAAPHPAQGEEGGDRGEGEGGRKEGEGEGQTEEQEEQESEKSESESEGSQTPPHQQQQLEPSTPPATPVKTEAGEGGSSTVVLSELDQATQNVANALITKEVSVHFKKVGISTLKLPHQGFCFKFDPITSFPEHSTSIEDVDRFIAALKQKVHAIHTTSLARRLLEQELKGRPNLRCLEFPSFFASGFIQYVPTNWAEKMELTLEEVSEINSLNIELSTILSRKNPVFSPFQHGNFSCIMIKELPPSTNLELFVKELLQETINFEDNKKFLAGMSEKILKGIETAQTDLSKERERKQHEEGLLRYVPIVGSVLNWWSPPTPTTPDGRTFSLGSGKVQTTTATYKYKMQIQQEGAEGAPPQPGLQGGEADGGSPQAGQEEGGGGSPQGGQGGQEEGGSPQVGGGEGLQEGAMSTPEKPVEQQQLPPSSEVASESQEEQATQ